MDDLHRRLDDFSLAIRELMKLDLQNRLPVTKETIFPVCSLAKGVSAAAMRILVDGGIASWEMLVKDATPSFYPNNIYLYNNTTLADLYSHRSGTSSCGNLVGGCEGNILIAKEERDAPRNRYRTRPAPRGSGWQCRNCISNGNYPTM
ncbi:hypothetical protein HZ326_19728 [Fusarium oxysporum f. sp. albedinis]|nr:hypothetical protein HZ326_19728 [Fusarium oxysporum f. sp. albedinis]